MDIVPEFQRNAYVTNTQRGILKEYTIVKTVHTLSDNFVLAIRMLSDNAGASKSIYLRSRRIFVVVNREHYV